MRSVADEWREWGDVWRAGGRSEAETFDSLKRRVTRGRVLVYVYVAVEVIITLSALALVVRQALRTPEAWNVAAMTALGVLALAAMGFSVWNRTGTWSPVSQSTRAFLDLLALRLERRLRALRYGILLLTLEAAVLAPWLWLLLAARAGRSGVPLSMASAAGWFVLLAAWIGLFVAGCLWGVSRTRRQLSEVQAVRRGLGEPVQPG